MNGEVLWNRIIERHSVSGEEIQTSTGLWFKVSSHECRLCVDKAVDHTPSSKLSMKRRFQ